jgi:thiamine pyrophosphokinase
MRNNRKYNFDVFICLNGRLSQKIPFLKKDELIIAADGAFKKLLKINLIPDIVIGDFDSIGNYDKSEYLDTEFIFDPDQETNDFEKILNYCLKRKLKDILIFGINGGQLEHTLNNLSVMMKFSDKLDLKIYDRSRIGYIINNHQTISTDQNEIISLIPLPKSKLSTKNLKWSLENEVLELGNREGARNLSIGENVEIDIKEGKILLFYDF